MSGGRDVGWEGMGCREEGRGSNEERAGHPMIPSSPDASGFICSSDKFKNISNPSEYQQEGGERASIQGRKRREREEGGKERGRERREE